MVADVIALGHYGYRRIAALLRNAGCLAALHLPEETPLQCRPASFSARTSSSSARGDHPCEGPTRHALTLTVDRSMGMANPNAFGRFMVHWSS